MKKSYLQLCIYKYEYRVLHFLDRRFRHSYLIMLYLQDFVTAAAPVGCGRPWHISGDTYCCCCCCFRLTRAPSSTSDATKLSHHPPASARRGACRKYSMCTTALITPVEATPTRTPRFRNAWLFIIRSGALLCEALCS